MCPWASSLTVGAVPARRLRHWWSPQDYWILPLPHEYLLPLPVPSSAVAPEVIRLSRMIYPGIYRAGYGRFRPNNSDHHLGCRYYRGGWHRSYPALIPRASYTQEKHTLCACTWIPPIAVSRSVEFSRLLRPVGPGFVSQNPTPGDLSQGPYPSEASRDFTPTTT